MKTDVKSIFIWESKIVRWNRILAKCRFLATHSNLYENFTPIAYPWDGDSNTPILWNFKFLISCNILCICNKKCWISPIVFCYTTKQFSWNITWFMLTCNNIAYQTGVCLWKKLLQNDKPLQYWYMSTFLLLQM